MFDDRLCAVVGAARWRSLFVLAYFNWCCRTVAGGDHRFVSGFFLKTGGARRHMEKLARTVSDPSSGSYGAYLTQDQIAQATGITVSQTEYVASYIKEAVGGSITVGAHLDLVTVSTYDWLPTYNLGEKLLNPGYEHEISGKLASYVELILTPGAPDKQCSNHTNTSQAECEAAGPCTWSEDKDWRNCTGDSAGWMCWNELNEDSKTNFKWHCIDQLNLTFGNGSANVDNQYADVEAEQQKRSRREIWKQRRRGRARSLLEPVESWSTLAENETNEARFRIHPASRKLSLLTAPANFSWTSVEFAYRHLGMRQSILVTAKDCVAGRRYASCRVNAVFENLHPVDEMYICVDFSGVYKTTAGCTCGKNSTLDELGTRLCKKLSGSSPFQDPVDFVLPYEPASASAVRSDLGIPGVVTVSTLHSASQAVGEFADQTFTMKDTKTSYELFGLNPSLLNVTVDTSHYYSAEKHDAGEGSLDMQFITAVAPGAPTTWIGIHNFNMDGFMFAYLTHLSNHPDPPLVHSISWGDSEVWWPPAVIRRIDYEFMKMALRGISILISSGDQGIGSSNCRFAPDLTFSEWVTQVGATMRSAAAAPYCSYNLGIGVCEERGPVVCSTTAGAVITSGGGFSMYRKRPAYQEDAVGSYFSMVNLTKVEEHSVPCIFFDNDTCTLGPMMAENRAAPDIAAPGHDFPVVVEDELGLYDGTSAAAPSAAAMFTLLNAEQSRRGQPPLGFLNPWLYQVQAAAPHAFADVTVGSIASTEKYQCKVGFDAAPGWDPATGLGVPQFGELRQLLPSRGQAALPLSQGERSAVRDIGPGLEAAAVTQPTVQLTTHTFVYIACGVAGMLAIGVAAVLGHRIRWRCQMPVLHASRQPLL